MKNGVDKNERLQMIIEKLCDGKKVVLAERLGKSQQNMSALIKNGTWYDACALAEAFPELSHVWLLKGEGEMISEENDFTQCIVEDDSESDVYDVSGQEDKQQMKEMMKGLVRETIAEMLT